MPINDNISDYSNFINASEILEKLNLCISTGGAPLGGTLSVGIYDQTSIDNLSKAIATGISRRKDTEFQKSIKEGITSIRNSVDAQKNAWIIAFEKHAKEQTDREKEAFSPLKNFTNGFIKAYPAISKVAELVSTFATFEYEQQMKWMNWYQQINESGVYLSGGMDSLTEKANKAGLKLDDMVKLYTKHSDVVADMGGLFENGTEAFAKLVSLTKDTGKKLGMTADQNAEITANFAKDYAWLYSQQVDGVEELSIRTNQYLMHLDKLSKATGKSWQTIEKETEAREKEFRIQLWLSNDENKKKKQIWDQLGLSKEIQEALMFGLPNSKSAMLQANDPELYALLQRGASLEELKAHAMKRANLTNAEYQRWQENNLGIMGEEWNSLMMGHTFVERNLMKMDLEQNSKDENEESNAKTFEKLRNIQEELNRVLNGFTQTLKISDNNLSAYVSGFEELTKKVTEYVNTLTDFTNQHPYISTLGIALTASLTQAFGGSLINFFGKEFTSLFKINGNNAGIGAILGNIGKNVFGIAAKIGVEGALAYTIFSGFKESYELAKNPQERIKQDYEDALKGNDSFAQKIGIAWDYYINLSGNDLSEYDKQGERLRELISERRKELFFESSLLIDDEYQQWLNNLSEFDKNVMMADDYKDAVVNQIKSQLSYGGGDELLNNLLNKNISNKELIEQLNNFKVQTEENNAERINQEMMQQKNNDEKERLNQIEKMKEREMVLQEQQRQKEVLEQKLKDVEQDNTKNSLECLRSIDTKLNILMNIDGKYDDIKNIANTLRINNEYASMDDGKTY